MNLVEQLQKELGKALSIEGLQKDIVKALEAGIDPAPLQKTLADLRAAIVGDSELAEMQKVVAKRQALRDKAQRIRDQAQKQGEAIDAFLKLRDSVIAPLAQVMESAKQLPALQQECFTYYHDAGSVAWKEVTDGYLPDDFTIPILTMSSGVSTSDDVAAQALFYLQAGYGLLANLIKDERPVPKRPAVGLEAIEDDPLPDPPCTVCRHPDKEAIDKAIKEGMNLRDIADKFGPSKSTLSRHKAHMDTTNAEVKNETN